jgi:hypothetical protein
MLSVREVALGRTCPPSNGPCQSRKRQAERALHRDLELLREQKHDGVSSFQKELPHAHVTVAPKEGHVDAKSIEDFFLLS